MANYYFLTTLLPPLKVGSPPEMSSRELHLLLKQNLYSRDLAKIAILRRFVDIENIRAIWLKAPFEIGGNFDEQELGEKLLFKQNLPTYVMSFLEKYPEQKERLSHFPELLQSFYKEEIQQQQGFLAYYLRLEWEWRLVFVALRAKELGRDVVAELEIADPEDPLVHQLLAQKETPTLQLPEPFDELQAIFEARKHSPLDLYQAISEWRFAQIEKKIEWDSFSMEHILGYIAQVDIIEQWLELDKRKGLEIVEEMIGMHNES